MWKTRVGCPTHLLEILKYQTQLSEPSLHAKYMKFRITKSPIGLIGKSIFMVGIINIHKDI